MENAPMFMFSGLCLVFSWDTALNFTVYSQIYYIAFYHESHSMIGYATNYLFCRFKYCPQSCQQGAYHRYRPTNLMNDSALSPAVRGEWNKLFRSCSSDVWPATGRQNISSHRSTLILSCSLKLSFTYLFRKAASCTNGDLFYFFFHHL